MDRVNLTDLILPELLPKIRAGADGKGAQLTKDDCERLLTVLSVSVTIETLIETMAVLCRNTLNGDQLDRPRVAVRWPITDDLTPPEKSQ